MIVLRRMIAEDLVWVARWLREPHVARWWSPETTIADEVEKYRRRLKAGSRVRMLTVLERGEDGIARRVGWCQWYPYEGDPEGARAVGAGADEYGIDYAIGDPQAVGRGLGTELIPALVAEIRRHHPRCSIVADPDAANIASRCVLERAGFSFVELRPSADGAGGGRMAVYRLTAPRAV